jgi:hypothetical protein
MEYVLEWFIQVVIGWVGLLVTMLVAQRIADFSMPPLRDFLWKAAIVVAIVSAISIGLNLINGWVSFVATLIVFIGLMEKLFDLDFWQITAIVLVNRVLVFLVYMAILAAVIANSKS